MDFKKLLEPYNQNGRTIEAQRLWLAKKGIPPDIIDHVCVEVYREIEQGKTFIDGTDLDHEMLRRARNYINEAEQEKVKKLEERAATLEEKFKPSGSKWDKIKMVMKGEL
jgi:hypothetical protein